VKARANTGRNVTLTHNDQRMSRYLTLYVPSHCASKPPKYFSRIKPPQQSGNNRAQQFGAYRGGGAGHEVHLGEVHRGRQLLDHIHGALALWMLDKAVISCLAQAILSRGQNNSSCHSKTTNKQGGKGLLARERAGGTLHLNILCVVCNCSARKNP
jgi:hypothetical protein